MKKPLTCEVSASDFDIAIQIIGAVMTLKIYARCPAQITPRKVAMSCKL